MLNPNKDRLDYGHILTPPEGFTLDFAVGTTYSLDFDALVGATLSLGLSLETDSDLFRNPVCLLETLRRTGDRIALFCEEGQIHMPGRVTSLYILLEKIVFTVKTEKHENSALFPSFHPKIWLIRYAGKEEKRYRIIVLSRNLTFDRSWDISCYMDGNPVGEIVDKNGPLCDFLDYLISAMPSDENGTKKAEKIRELSEELHRVRFQLQDKEFEDYEFIPSGIKKSDGGWYRFHETELFTESFHEAFLMSPFLSRDIVKSFSDRSKASRIKETRMVLITREMSLGRILPEDYDGFRIFTLRDAIIDGEAEISEENPDIQKQDIHAKVFMIRKNSNSQLYLGSLNATHHAVYHNVEFMLCFRAKNRYLNLDKLLESLFGKYEDENAFQEINPTDIPTPEEEEQVDSISLLIKELAHSQFFAVVNPEEEAYSLRVCFEEINLHGCVVEVCPLLGIQKQKEKLAKEITFKGLTEIQLSEFYVISIESGGTQVERVFLIPTEGLPEEREKSVVTGIVNNRESFYQYISFLLGDDFFLFGMEGEDTEAGKSVWNHRALFRMPALYEKMLRTAALAPERFEGIDYLMKTIQEDGIIPEDFRRLYETFRKVVKIDGAYG